MSEHDLKRRLFELEARVDQIHGLKAKIKQLESALASSATGQQSQDEAIVALQRRVERLETRIAPFIPPAYAEPTGAPI